MFTEEISGVALSNFSQVLNEQINIDQILLAALHARYCARNNQAAHIVGGTVVNSFVAKELPEYVAPLTVVEIVEMDEP